MNEPSDKLAEWLREKPDVRSAHAEAKLQNYDGIALTLQEDGRPNWLGVGWDLAEAFARAMESGATD